VLCVHSDNAAQHFKSSKSLHWLSKQIEGMGFKSVLWDFGPPGHGKGEWDGLGGMLKQWIRQRKLSKLSVDPNEAAVRLPVEDSDDEDADDDDANEGNLLASADACYKKWKSHFETEDWRRSAKDAKRSVNAIYFHWAGLNDIKRPKTNEEFDCLEGISSSYQFLMLREGNVLMRKHSCWCQECFNVAMRDTLLSSNADYPVAGCDRAQSSFYQWSHKSCRAKTGGSAASLEKRARTHGHELASQLTREGGEWVLAEATNDEEDLLWLGRTVAFSNFDGACYEKHTGSQKKRYGTRFDKNDYLVAVQWYERLCESGDGERREFVMAKPEIDVINSTELRLAGFDLRRIGEFPTDVSDVVEGEVQECTDVASQETRQKWELALRDECEATNWCR